MRVAHSRVRTAPQCTHIEGIATSVRASLGADSPLLPLKCAMNVVKEDGLHAARR